MKTLIGSPQGKSRIQIFQNHPYFSQLFLKIAHNRLRQASAGLLALFPGVGNILESELA
jgi:hypothetical protein